VAKTARDTEYVVFFTKGRQMNFLKLSSCWKG